MDYSDVAERVSQKFGTKSQHVDREKIIAKLRRLVEEFGVPPTEAERTVTNELARDLGISGIGQGPAEKKMLAGLAPGEWVTVEGKVVSLTTPPSPAIAQTGILADESGAIRFVVWAKAKALLLAEGGWYRFESAVVDEFKGVPNLKVHSGTVIRELTRETPLIPAVVPINALRPGVGSVKAKVIQEWETTHDRMLQSGLLADETGTVKFIIWKEEGKERLTTGKVYSLYYALVDEYNARLSLNLTSAMVMPEEGDIEVTGGDREVTGAVVHIAPGSGLIKRCPVPGCNRVLSRQNYCPVHEIQDKFTYDLRIKGWLDNGERTWELLMPRDAVESLTGLALDQAREIAENHPLGLDEVLLRIRGDVLGRYISCKGREIDGRILASSCRFSTYDPTLLAALLNRAGGAVP
ncbi:MAG: nucleotide-binding protein [Methanoregulaceae archaeon]|nr:nucleotide-binding protein [Methanoregulaceae archaeon]